MARVEVGDYYERKSNGVVVLVKERIESWAEEKTGITASVKFALANYPDIVQTMQVFWFVRRYRFIRSSLIN